MRPLRYAFVALLLLVGCDRLTDSPRPLSNRATLDVYVVSPVKTPSCKQATDPITNAVIFLKTPPITTAADVTTIERSEDSQGAPSLSLNLTPAGVKKLATATANPKGMRIAVAANGTVVATFKLMAPAAVPTSTGFSISGGEIPKTRDSLFEMLTAN